MAIDPHGYSGGTPLDFLAMYPDPKDAALALGIPPAEPEPTATYKSGRYIPEYEAMPHLPDKDCRGASG